MAQQLLIVHGYSDGSSSFTALGDYLVAAGCYPADKVHYVDYASMDDEADFLDFADKLDSDHRQRFGAERIDVVCHSTGSLVVRAWLALHARRNALRGLHEPCPVDKLVCLAPANFGSDLAGMGQSFLGKFRSTFFNSNAHREDFLESGKRVLQGLEPASPFQWLLSFDHDLHSEYSYFKPNAARPELCCRPFVLAAGDAYHDLPNRLIKQRTLPGTDGTVRIAGTSLNTRACTLDFRTRDPVISWWPHFKYDDIPFAVFAGVNHGSIIDPATAGYDADDAPGGVMRAVLSAGPLSDARYAEIAAQFTALSEVNYARLPDGRRDRYQQFFFRVRDDVDQLVDDFFIDFYVLGSDGEVDAALTKQFDETFETQVYVHSASRAHRVFMLNCSGLDDFTRLLAARGARLMVQINGVSRMPDVHYALSTFIAFDPAAARSANAPTLLFPNTTTLVDVVLDREESDKLMTIASPTPRAAPLKAAAPAATVPTGRAAAHN